MLNPDKLLWRRVFGRAWAVGVPVVVRAVRRGYDWRPDTMARAIREKNPITGATDTTIDVRASSLPCLRCQES